MINIVKHDRLFSIYHMPESCEESCAGVQAIAAAVQLYTGTI